ncbi:ROK family transcriptional regulator [Glycomyces tenuis]|uniref:ROK family transcriptional regulator n=1 Tax=Glycomyces tenuis TaxID=58116 RepID=UPI0004243DDE|nr:ROK family transcriptional regulator [Glycomyces tenuis]
MARPATEELRRRNRSALLERLHRHGPQTRAELTEALGVNRSTIGALAADLSQSGHIRETTGRSTGSAGRPSTLVECVAEAARVAAVEIRAGLVRLAVVGLGGAVLERAEAPLAPGVDAAEAAAAVDRLLDGAEASDAVSDAVVAVPGLVDGPTVARSGELGWAGLDFGAELHQATGRRWRVVDTATAAAVGEWSRGDAGGSANLLYLHGGRGLTAGIVADGRPRRGSSIALGHLVVAPEGAACECGLRGCLEAEMGAGEYAASIETTTVAAWMGDSLARQTVQRSGECLGRALGAVVTAVNPDEILFGGWLRELYLASAATVRSSLAATTLPQLRARLRLRTPALGAEGPLVGAAETGFEALIDDMR